MNAAANLLLENLARTTLALALAGIAASVVLRLVRSQWPAAHRAAWLLVLLVGWTFLRLPVAVPWYEPAPAAPPVADLALAPSEPISSPQIIELAPEIPPSNLPAEAAPSIPQTPSAVSIPKTPQPAIVPAAPETVPAQPWHTTIDWPAVVVAAWILGMALCAAAWLVGYLRFVRLLADRQPADDVSAAAWRELLSAAGVRQSIPLTVSHQFGPMLCCLPRGYELIVPADLWSELDAAGQGAILRHELAHHQRGDVWKSLAARILALPHWFNPFAWLAVRRFEEAAEWACDRAAVAHHSSTEYAKLLVHLGRSPHALGYGSSARGRTLATRVRRVLSAEEQNDSKVKIAALLLLGLAIAAASAVQLHLVAQEPAPRESAGPEKAPVPPTDERPLPEKTPGTSNGFQVFKTLRDGEQPIPPEKQTLEELHKKLFNEATRAYEAHLAAFDAQTVMLPTVYEWSLRWMTAAEALAKNKDERIAAARGHVQRMSELQKKVRLLYQLGSKGGEAAQDAAATFYLAEAERHLAEVEASGTSEKVAPLGDSPSASRDAARQMVEQCKQVYEFNKSQSIQNVPMETQVTWSLRWLRAAELAARHQSERIVAARDHVKRVSELKDATDQLFKIGARGGGASDVAAATYYLAEAERHLADVEAHVSMSGNRSKAAEDSSAVPKIDITDIVKGSHNVATIGGYQKYVREHEQRTLSDLHQQLTEANAKLARGNLDAEQRQATEAARRSLMAAIDFRSPDNLQSVGGNHVQPGLADRELETVDLQIKLTELRGELDQTVIQIKTAESRLAGYRRILSAQSNALSSSEVTKAEGEVQRLKVQRLTLEEQIKLHERKLALLKRQPQPRDAAADAAERPLPSTPAQPKLLYAGKTFDDWLNILREDLDPASRAEAIGALAAFANHGHGRQVAQAIVDVFKDYKLVPVDSSPMGVMRTKSMYAFSRMSDGSVATIPTDDAMAVVLKALGSENANQRLFATFVVQQLADKDTVVPLLVERLKDSDNDVRGQAAMFLLRRAPDSPGLLDAMRQWLSPELNPRQSQMAISALGTAPRTMQLQLAPELVKLLDREAVAMRFSEDSRYASNLLLALGPDAIPAVEEGLKSDNQTVRERSQQILDVLRKQKAEQRLNIEPTN